MLTEEQIEELVAIGRAGGTVDAAEYISVEWDPNDSGETRYYSTSKYDQIPPFANIGLDIEPRILGEPFKQFELYPDLRTDTIPIDFEDIDQTIKAKFQGFGSGLRIEFFQYYPQVDAHDSMWFGQLLAPQNYGRKKQQAIATNGFRSREQMLPRSLRPRECRHRAYTGFGGQLTAEALQTAGCKYDRHLGGTIGNYRTGTTPYETCPGDETACAARGMTPYFGGYKPDASAVVTDKQSGYLAVSKGNTSSLKQPIRFLFGTKTVRANQLLFWRREMNAKEQGKGFAAGVWEVGEGPNRSIRNIKVGEKTIEQQHIATRLGFPAQPALTQYAPDIGRYSNVALYFARKGWVDPLTENAQTMQSECVVEGFSEVTTLNETAAGAGLKAEFYASTTVGTDKVGERIDATINRSSTSIVPFSGLSNTNGFSIKWTGTITFPFSEIFTFTSIHDDGVLLTINGGTVINQSSAGTHTGTFAATAGTPYSFDLRIVQNANGGLFAAWASILKWESSSQTQQVVPSSAFAHTGASGVAKIWTNNRIWCLLELMHNQRGMSYPLSRFNAASWTGAAAFSFQNVTFSYTNVDGETRNFAHTRTKLDAVIDGRPVAEQIVDICRSGRFSVPFQKNGEFHIEPFRAFTDAELANAKVFTDVGPTRNILVDNGEPLITVSQTSDDTLVNEVTLVFEDGAHNDQERPITVDNPNQKVKAGRTLGGNNLHSVPIRYAAFGTRNLNEVVKLGYSVLRFGEFDEGGILNNLTVSLEVPLVEALGVQRYGPIKVSSDILDGFLLPIDDELSGFEQAEYFRVLRILKTSRHTAQIVAQVYNHTAYEAFEGAVTSYPPGTPPDPEPDTDPIPVPPPSPVFLTAVDYNSADKVLSLITTF